MSKIFAPSTNLGKTSSINQKEYIPVIRHSKSHDFREYIRKSLSDSKILSQKYVEILTDTKSMENFTRAFTTRGYNPLYNYEVFEVFGDITANKIIVWYF